MADRDKPRATATSGRRRDSGESCPVVDRLVAGRPGDDQAEVVRLRRSDRESIEWGIGRRKSLPMVGGRRRTCSGATQRRPTGGSSAWSPTAGGQISCAPRQGQPYRGRGVTLGRVARPRPVVRQDASAPRDRPANDRPSRRPARSPAGPARPAMRSRPLSYGSRPDATPRPTTVRPHARTAVRADDRRTAIGRRATGPPARRRPRPPQRFDRRPPSYGAGRRLWIAAAGLDRGLPAMVRASARCGRRRPARPYAPRPQRDREGCSARTRSSSAAGGRSKRRLRRGARQSGC